MDVTHPYQWPWADLFCSPCRMSPLKGGVPACTPGRGVLEDLAAKQWDWAFIGHECESCVSWPAVSAQHLYLPVVSLLVPLSGTLPGLPHLHLSVRRLGFGIDGSGWFQHHSTPKAARDPFSCHHRQLCKQGTVPVVSPPLQAEHPATPLQQIVPIVCSSCERGRNPYSQWGCVCPPPCQQKELLLVFTH